MSDREDELMDRILREAASIPAPGLSGDFDRGLARKFRPRRLKARARLAMILYTLAAVAASIWAVWPIPILWVLVTLGLLSSLISAWMFWRYQRGDHIKLLR